MYCSAFIYLCCLQILFNSNLFCCAKLVVKQGRKAMGLQEEDRQAAKMNPISFVQHPIKKDNHEKFL
jgi:hypothetical protein